MMRSHQWAHRALIEYDRAGLTWFGTFTLSPESHAIMDARVAKRAQTAGASWLTDWTRQELFRARAREVGAEITKWCKRLRSEGRVFRYLLVAEEHTGARRKGTLENEGAVPVVTGRPHWHILVHEKVPGDFIKPDETYVSKGEYTSLRADDRSLPKTMWPWGFTQFKALETSDEAFYLCKYLSKDMLWRVRASQNYGKAEAVESASVDEQRVPGRSESVVESSKRTLSEPSEQRGGADVDF